MVSRPSSYAVKEAAMLMDEVVAKAESLVGLFDLSGALRWAGRSANKKAAGRTGGLGCRWRTDYFLARMA